MLKFFLVAHLTYENQWVSLRNKIRTFGFLGHPIDNDNIDTNICIIDAYKRRYSQKRYKLNIEAILGQNLIFSVIWVHLDLFRMFF